MCPGFLAKRVEPDFVIVDELVCVRDFFLRHFFDHFLLADGRIGIAANGREHVPHIGANQIGSFEPQAGLVVPANPGLGARMAFHRGAQIPFKRANPVLLDTEAQSVHRADELLGFGIARARRRPKLAQRFLKTVGLHQVARLFKLRQGGSSHQQPRPYRPIAHLILLLWLLAASPLLAAERATSADFLPFDPKAAALGQLLFYDPILSGNRNISCGTCHHHDHGTSDGLSLGIGEGGVGLGPERRSGDGAERIKKRIPRNSPGLWNLGAREVHTLFHDGRLSRDDAFGNGFNSPAEEWLPEGLSGLLAAQALLPLTSQFEMAGSPGENDVAGAAHDRIDAVWPIIAERIRGIDEYRTRFAATFGIAAQDISIVHIANALADFINAEWQSIDSRYDRHLAGELALTPLELTGLDLFFGKAGCASCHSGNFFTDQKFYALMLPTFGPGRTRLFDPMPRDTGRMAETDRLDDAYRFKTPSLRNVELTAPYGHNGAYPTLDGIVRHHLAPARQSENWQQEMAALPAVPWLQSIDFVITEDARERARYSSRLDIKPVDLHDQEIDAVVAFLKSLTGTRSRYGRLGRPEEVPSGGAVD